jgi:hypothetical protein
VFPLYLLHIRAFKGGCQLRSSRIPGSAALVGSFAAIVFAIPVFICRLIVAPEFRSAESPAAALGANMLGAVGGGLLENLSLIIGMKALLSSGRSLVCTGRRRLPRTPIAAGLLNPKPTVETRRAASRAAEKLRLRIGASL